MLEGDAIVAHVGNTGRVNQAPAPASEVGKKKRDSLCKWLGV